MYICNHLWCYSESFCGVWRSCASSTLSHIFPTAGKVISCTKAQLYYNLICHYSNDYFGRWTHRYYLCFLSNNIGQDFNFELISPSSLSIDTFLTEQHLTEAKQAIFNQLHVSTALQRGTLASRKHKCESCNITKLSFLESII